MSENEEMSAEETAALLRDLETRSSTRKAPAVEDDGEDVEAFLKRLEAEEAAAAPRPVMTRDKAPLDDEFAALKEAPTANLVKVEEKPEKSEKAKKEKSEKTKKEKSEKTKKEKSDVKVVERGKSDGLHKAGIVLKWTVILLPVLLATWLVGAFVAQWVSAGWLVALIALIASVGIPVVVKLATHKGRVSWWVGGMSLVAVVALTAPMPHTTAKVLTSYGHWPASTVASAAGWSADHFTVRASQWLADRLAGLLSPAIATGGLRLGTQTPIVEPPAPKPTTTPGTPVEPKTPDAPATPAPPEPANPVEGTPASGSPVTP